MTPLVLQLGDGVVFSADRDAGSVVTRYGDRPVVGVRHDTEENRAEAADQGYGGPMACWQSLAEHELLHTLATRALWGRESHVLLTLAGLELAPYAVRMHEEALVLSLQRWLCRGVRDLVLSHVSLDVMSTAVEARRLLGGVT